MIDVSTHVARLRRVSGGDVLYRDSSPSCLVVDVGLELTEWPHRNPAPPRRPFSIPLLVGVPNTFEPFEHDRLVVGPRLLDYQRRDPVENLSHTFLLSSGTCKPFLQTPV